MSYYEEYMEEPTPNSVSYETYWSDIHERDNKIEELEFKNSDLQDELDDAKKIIKTLKEELNKYENKGIQKNA